MHNRSTGRAISKAGAGSATTKARHRMASHGPASRTRRATHDLFRRLWPKRADAALHGLQTRPIGLHRLPHAASHLGLGHVGRSQSGQTRGKRCTPSGNRPPCSSAFGQGSPPTPGRPRKGFGMDGEGDSHGQCSPFEPWSAEFECSPISRQTIDKPWRRRERSDATPLICF